jgi:hypothetical protein
MKVTIVQQQILENDSLVFSNELIYYPHNNDELKSIPLGNRAEKIKIENLEFTKEDIPHLIEFLRNCEPCFKSY